MKKLSKIAKAILALAVAALFIVSCANPLQSNLTSGSTAGAKSLQDAGPPTSYTLWAGQNINAGTVSVSRDSGTLYVVYRTNEKYLIGGVHVWVGTSLADLPTNNQGIPVPGQFPVNQPVNPAASEVVVSVPLGSWTAGTQLFIFTHAELIGQNVNGTQYGNETGWAGDKSLDIARWNFYFSYTLPTYTPPAPPPTPTTTYSISGFVFHDMNNNGVRDNGEEGLSGVKVTLSSGADATTGPDGSYSFSNLVAGTYTVTSNGWTGYFATPYSAPVNSKSVTVPASQNGVNFGLSYETLKGVAFYDANKDGAYQVGEPLLSGVAIQLSTGASTISASDGSYTFTNLKGDESYTVTSADLVGFLHSNPASQSTTLGAVYSDPKVVNFGFALDYNWIGSQTANGYTIGFWKTNIDKAIAGSTKGIQVSKATLESYRLLLSSFALEPLNIASLSEASGILSSTSSNPVDLLKKQLMGSEFNYANRAYIGGNALVTYFFLYDGEYMLTNPGAFSFTQLLAQKDKYDAYNNSHGGQIIF